MLRLLCCSLLLALTVAAVADLSGTWSFSVDLDNGSHGSPMFVLTQKGTALTGAYKGPLGEKPVTGKVTGNQASFGFEFTQEAETVKATYTARLESAAKMSGTVEFKSGAGDATTGKWTATKK